MPPDVRTAFVELLLQLRLVVLPADYLDTESAIGRARYDVRGIAELLAHVAGKPHDSSGSDHSFHAGHSTSSGHGPSHDLPMGGEDVQFEIHSEAGGDTEQFSEPGSAEMQSASHSDLTTTQLYDIHSDAGGDAQTACVDDARVSTLDSKVHALEQILATAPRLLPVWVPTFAASSDPGTFMAEANNAI